jgi:hypothetical protein
VASFTLFFLTSGDGNFPESLHFRIFKNFNFSFLTREISPVKKKKKVISKFKLNNTTPPCQVPSATTRQPENSFYTTFFSFSREVLLAPP